MSQWPPSTRLSRRSRRIVLWIAALLAITFVTLGKSASWAAPVTAPRNQTVPPGERSTYLPTVGHTLPEISCESSLFGTLEKNSGFSTLLQTLEAADLITALEDGGPFTMFAPTDAAFASLPAGALDQLLANPTGQLREILLFHIVPGEYEIDDLENGMGITTQQGSLLQVERLGDCDVLINGGRILTPDMPAINGIIHAIDTVLLPPPDAIAQ